jgi:hypothetical protein
MLSLPSKAEVKIHGPIISLAYLNTGKLYLYLIFSERTETLLDCNKEAGLCMNVEEAKFNLSSGFVTRIKENLHPTFKYFG